MIERARDAALVRALSVVLSRLTGCDLRVDSFFDVIDELCRTQVGPLVVILGIDDVRGFLSFET